MLELKYRTKYIFALLTSFTIFVLLYESYNFKFSRPSYINQLLLTPRHKQSNQSQQYNYTLHIITVSDVERQKNYQQHSIRLATNFLRFFRKFYFYLLTRRIQLALTDICSISIYDLLPTFR